MADIDVSILLEWVNSLDWVDDAGTSVLEDLSDGQMLLRVMHDVSPLTFPGPGDCSATPLRSLLAGLLDHFGDHGVAKGRTQGSVRRLQDQEAKGARVDASLLLQLVVVATILSTPPEQHRYESVFEALSESCQEAIGAVVQHFTQEDDGEGPVDSRGVQPTRSASASPALPFATPMPLRPRRHERPPSSSFPDWMEVGLDTETRFRRLKDLYTAEKGSWEEDREHWEEERQHLQRELKAERSKRQAAEEAERMARAEIRIADEAQDRVKEESRAMLEVRLESAVAPYIEEAQTLRDEVERLKEELDIVRSTAARADKLKAQVETLKRKLEEVSQRERERDELGQASRPDGAGQHLHDRLAGVRRELDEQRLQNELLQGTLEDLRREKLAAEQELSRRSSVERRTGAAGIDRGSDDGAAPEVLKSPTMDRRNSGSLLKPPSPSGGLEEVKKLLQSGQGELLEKLLAEKERATRAETTLQLREAEVASLREQKARETAVLEEKLRGESAALKELQSRPCEGPPAEDTEKVKELQALLAQRDRELQVHRWRGRAESDSLAQQEALMSTCFHELGLQYHRLRIQHQILQRRSGEGERLASLSRPPEKR